MRWTRPARSSTSSSTPRARHREAQGRVRPGAEGSPLRHPRGGRGGSLVRAKLPVFRHDSREGCCGRLMDSFTLSYESSGLSTECRNRSFLGGVHSVTVPAAYRDRRSPCRLSIPAIPFGLTSAGGCGVPHSPPDCSSSPRRSWPMPTSSPNPSICGHRSDRDARPAACRAPDRHCAPLRIVAFGSSSTEGIGASSPTKAYPARLQPTCAPKLHGIDVTVVNRGIGGEHVDDMLKRLDRDVIAPSRSW